MPPFGRGGLSQEALDWAEKHGVPDCVADCLVGVPVAGEEGEFYIKLEHLGNKHYLSSADEADLVAWLKLTAKVLYEYDPA